MTEQQQPPNSVQVIIFLNGTEAGKQTLPLPPTYAQAEQGLQTLFVNTGDALARLYTAVQEQEIAALRAQLTAPGGAPSP